MDDVLVACDKLDKETIIVYQFRADNKLHIRNYDDGNGIELERAKNVNYAIIMGNMHTPSTHNLSKLTLLLTIIIFY